MTHSSVHTTTNQSCGPLPANTIPFIYHDGGRLDAGFRGDARDCVARSIAIAAELPYKEVYQRLAQGNAAQRVSRQTKKRPKSARNGINTKRKWFKDYMQSLGFRWFPTKHIGSPVKIHLAHGELPQGRLVVSVSKHYTAVIDGTIYDTYDCSRHGTRCVYGYWLKM